MTANTKIEWADHTFNPWIGCQKVGPGCDHCYAEQRMDTRLHVVKWGPGQARKRTSETNWRDPLKWERNAAHFVECIGCGRRGDARTWQDDIRRTHPSAHTCCPDRKLTPARQRVFCASLADVFDNAVDPLWRVDLFRLIAATPNLDWLLLTKRIGNVVAMIHQVRFYVQFEIEREFWLWLKAWENSEEPPANVWLGATIVNQEEADRDIPKLLAVPAAKRFLSMEPLLGPVDIAAYLHREDGVLRCPKCGFTTNRWLYEPCPNDGKQLGADIAIDWVIAGGESGPHARPMHPAWARSLRDQCWAAGVPFLFKQWGEYIAADDDACDPGVQDSRLMWSDGQKWDKFDGQRFGPELMARVGKKAAGRLLDGIEHNGFPS